MGTKLFADAGVIRTAILEVADAGWQCSARACGIKHLWIFEDDESDDQTEHRERFADAVLERIRKLQSPVFALGIRLENMCASHMRECLPPPTVETCPECEKELRAKL